jgi:hypothetical protein
LRWVTWGSNAIFAATTSIRPYWRTAVASAENQLVMWKKDDPMDDWPMGCEYFHGRWDNILNIM